jgi:hypothetical protein
VTKAADRAAEFTEFVEAGSASLLRAALVLLDTREEAEDALQLALLRTFRRWDHARQAPEAYSRAVLVNVCRERWRHRRRHPEVPGTFSDIGPLAEVVSFAEAVDRRHVLVRVAARSAPCRPRGSGTVARGHQQPGLDTAAAADPSGHCIVLMLTPPFRPTAPGNRGDPNIPPDARGISVGRYHAWLIPGGYARPGGITLVIEGTARGKVSGQVEDLVIDSTGLSQAALVSAVSAGLS